MMANWIPDAFTFAQSMFPCQWLTSIPLMAMLLFLLVVSIVQLFEYVLEFLWHRKAEVGGVFGE